MKSSAQGNRHCDCSVSDWLPGTIEPLGQFCSQQKGGGLGDTELPTFHETPN